MSEDFPSITELKELSDRELLIFVTERLHTISVNQTNHIRHHWMVSIACLSAGVIGLMNFSIALIVLFFSK